MEVLERVGRRGPVRAAEPVARMLAKKGADTVGAEIGHAILAGPGQNDRVGQDDFALVNTALKVAQNIVATGNVIAKVAHGLHSLGPFPPHVAPSSVAVELLVVLDERFAQNPLASPFLDRSVREAPYTRHVYLDGLVHDIQLIEPVDNL